MNKKNSAVPPLNLEQGFFQQLKLEPRPGLPLPGSEYESLFWRPYLGGIAFALWQVLVAFQPEAQAHQNGRWPTISVIEKTLGVGDRYTILGREATATRPEQAGELARLRHEGLVLYQTAGEGSATRYWFAVAEYLPLLAPAQAAKLPSVLARRHRKWIEGLGITGTWSAITSPTLIRPC